jgi:hypothetical protein
MATRGRAAHAGCRSGVVEVAKLRAKSRKRLKKSSFGLPGSRKYPMHDKKHAANAKARAKQQLKKGKLSRSSYNKIVAKANRKLGKSKKKKGR